MRTLAAEESHSFPTRRFSQRRSPQERFPTRRWDVAWSLETRASHCLISWPSIVRRNLEQSGVGRIWPRPSDWIAKRARGPNKRNLGFQSEYRPGLWVDFAGSIRHRGYYARAAIADDSNNPIEYFLNAGMGGASPMPTSWVCGWTFCSSVLAQAAGKVCG